MLDKSDGMSVRLNMTEDNRKAKIVITVFLDDHMKHFIKARKVMKIYENAHQNSKASKK